MTLGKMILATAEEAERGVKAAPMRREVGVKKTLVPGRVVVKGCVEWA